MDFGTRVREAECKSCLSCVSLASSRRACCLPSQLWERAKCVPSAPHGPGKSVLGSLWIAFFLPRALGREEKRQKGRGKEGAWQGGTRDPRSPDSGTQGAGAATPCSSSGRCAPSWA